MIKTIINYWRYKKMLKNITRDEEGLPHSVDDVPAIKSTKGTQCWYHHGSLHRTLGPAVIFFDSTAEWWINGVQVDKEVSKWCGENNRDSSNLSPEDVTFMWFSMGLEYDEKNRPKFSQL